MKASETIKKLSELVAKYGDGEVRVTHQSELASVWAVTGMDATLAYYLFSAGDTKIGWPSTIQRVSAPGMGEFSSKGVTD
jgi:hypothetical protein